ncbi:MAG TPA: homoserine dehydrogenase [Fimbriimonadaceae bacterium]|nr:homoserine dehydrogenase [Fimbriimonadaceae bacterium]
MAPSAYSHSSPHDPAARPIRIGMLGFGTVGSGAFRMLENNREAITRKVGRSLEIVRIGIRDSEKPRSLPPSIFTTDLDSILADPEIDVVLELIGGIDPAARLVEEALERGKNVVTANKELIAKHGSRLVHMAKARGLDLHFEAAVGGGIPLVQPLKHQLAGNDVLKLMGILNGTTNYILTRMTQEGADLEDVLSEAQTLGYAEADPTNDVDGFDAVYKLAILASICFGKQVPIDGVHREGIRGVNKLDIKFAEALGYRIKLLGIVEPAEDGAILARVHPTLIPKTHPLASVNDVYNAVWIHGDFVGDVMLSGRGAGSDPTASAVIGDLIDVGRNIVAGGPGSAIPYDEGMETVSIEQLETAYYVRMNVVDRPKVLGTIAGIFGDHEVSLAAMEMRVVDEANEIGEIVFLTHRCRESSFSNALTALQKSDAVREICSWIRVEA